MATPNLRDYNIEDKNCFDFLRIVFCADIIIAHLYELSQCKKLDFLSVFLDIGIFGLQAFFIISGFLVAKSYRRTSTLKRYFVKRAKRLFPAYLFLLFITVVVLSFFTRLSFLDYFTNSIFLNFMHPCLPGLFENNLLCAVNGALWTLKVEEGFYIVLPLIFYAIIKSRKPALVLISLYSFSLLYWFVMIFYLNQPLLAKQLPGYLSYFVTGIFLNLNLKYVLEHRKILFLTALVSLSITNFFSFQINILFPAAFGLLIIILAYSLPFFNNFGKYGYSCS